jgi:hypothetical protein
MPDWKSVLQGEDATKSLRDTAGTARADTPEGVFLYL